MRWSWLGIRCELSTHNITHSDFKAVVKVKYPDFKYIDHAIGSFGNRNNVIIFNELHIAIDIENCYTSMFLFKEEYQKLIKDNEKNTSKPSVRGANKFECWCPYLWFDIDAAKLEDATIDVQHLLRVIKTMGVLNLTVVFFSGSKGYHIGIPASLFGFVPSQTLPTEMKNTAMAIAELAGIKIDNVYDHNRLWRVVDTIHGNTKIRKTEFDPQKLIELTLGEIKKIASKKRKLKIRYVLCDVFESIDALVRLREESNIGKGITRDTSWTRPPLLEKYRRLNQAGLDFLLKIGVAYDPQGPGRDNEALLRASECCKLGISQADALLMLLEWNKLNDPALSDGDIERIVESAYKGNYDFGFGTESLRIAREEGRKALGINVIELLAGKINLAGEEVTYDRCWQTGVELLNEITPEVPEIVGEWFSWRKRLVLLAGREKLSGKSTLCTTEVIIALRKGHRVMWISPDEPKEDIKYRLIKVGFEDYAEQFYCSGDERVPRTWEELAQAILDVHPDLVILDSIHSLFPRLEGTETTPDSSETAQWQVLTAKLRPLAIILNCAIVWLHHEGKKGGVIGSVGITAGVDVIVTLNNKGLVKENRRNLIFTGRRVTKKLNCRIDFDEDTGFYTRVDEPFGNGTSERQQKEDSKNTVIYDWLSNFIISHDSKTFFRPTVYDACCAYFPEKSDLKKAFATALLALRNEKRIKEGAHINVNNKKGHEYIILDNTGTIAKLLNTDKSENVDE